MLEEIESDSINLVVTSPPYPMIEMWDSSFSNQNPAIGEALSKKQGDIAFELMHETLDKVWKQVSRVLRPGAFACINIGDATRKLGKGFKLYSNHSRILSYFVSTRELNPLPEILWRKQTNAPNKFMGSGMLPVGAYVTLEHEYILIFRKGPKREFTDSNDKQKRLESAFFWEERNAWFSDVWDSLRGVKQNGIAPNIRERSGAYPFDLAYRLINMFSLKEETVLDPFLGTGTTMAAAMCARRNSIGYEIDNKFSELLKGKFQDIVETSNSYIENRLNSHLQFVNGLNLSKRQHKYLNKHYGFHVMTKQEVEIVFNKLQKLDTQDDDCFEIYYSPRA